MRVIAIVLLVSAFPIGKAPAQQPAPADASPFIGTWCHTITNGTRKLTIKAVNGTMATGRYVWTGPGPIDEPIEGVISGDRFKGGNIVPLDLKLKQDTLVGIASRTGLADRVTMRRCS